MDCVSRFFYTLEKRSGAKKHITCLLAEDSTPLTDPAEMCGRARAFYAGLFSLDLTNPNACRVLWDELPTVSTGDRDRLELPLTLAKFLEALCGMPTNKSPGMDRLTMEFYCVFWDVLVPDLVTVWAKSLQNGVLLFHAGEPFSPYCRRRGTSTIYKIVSLLSTDYKVVVKAIPLRLGSMLADVVHLDQTYIVLGHTIFDNLKLMGLVLQEPELRLVLSAYTDNVLLMVQDPGDLVQVEACQAICSAASSARVNWVKSSGLVVGDRWQVSFRPSGGAWVRCSISAFTFLPRIRLCQRTGMV
ncbi:unnamed protein product [Caretta caretta]